MLLNFSLWSFLLGISLPQRRAKKNYSDPCFAVISSVDFILISFPHSVLHSTRMSIDRYDPIRVLGEGSFGKVSSPKENFHTCPTV